VIRVGCYSAQGVRPNNEDNFAVDERHRVYVVADGMGGHDRGEEASRLAAEIIPRAVRAKLDAQVGAPQALLSALEQAHRAIMDAGRNQPAGRRMGTTAVVALQEKDQCYVASLGDSRAYLVRDGKVQQLTVDHSVAKALELNGTLTPEQARTSPYNHVLYRFLGCAEMWDGAEVHPFAPRAGDCLILATDGLTNHVKDEDMRSGVSQGRKPQDLAEELVRLALGRGSRDNATAVVVEFVKE
jgi:PPM family protein phosphatase